MVERLAVNNCSSQKKFCDELLGITVKPFNKFRVIPWEPFGKLRAGLRERRRD